MELAVKYLRELLVVLLQHNLGASIDGLHIRRALGWDVEIYGVIWSHTLALIPALPSGNNPIPSLGHSIIFNPSPQIFYKLS